MAAQLTAEQWRDHYARRARTCATDALHAARCHRPDIAAVLRQVARDYLQYARYAALKAAQ